MRIHRRESSGYGDYGGYYWQLLRDAKLTGNMTIIDGKPWAAEVEYTYSRAVDGVVDVKHSRKWWQFWLPSVYYTKEKSRQYEDERITDFFPVSELRIVEDKRDLKAAKAAIMAAEKWPAPTG